MKTLLTLLLLSVCFPVCGQYYLVSTYKLASGAYEQYLWLNPEYRQNMREYRQLMARKQQLNQRFDSLQCQIENSDFTPYMKKETARLLGLVTNYQSGDLYQQLRTCDTRLVLSLNEHIPIQRLYHYERSYLQHYRQSASLQNWLKRLAAVSSWHYEKLVKGQLNNPVFSYESQLKSQSKL